MKNASQKNDLPMLVVCVGLPMSGIQEWARESKLPTVDLDGIRNVLHGRHFWTNAEALIWAFAKMMAGALFYAGHQEVVIAAPLWCKRHRDKWIDTRWNRRAVHFKTDKKTCIQRAREVGRDSEIKIIERMANTFDEPNPYIEGYVSVENIDVGQFDPSLWKIRRNPDGNQS